MMDLSEEDIFAKAREEGVVLEEEGVDEIA